MTRKPTIIALASCAMLAALPAGAWAATPPVLDQYANPAAAAATPVAAPAAGSAATPAAATPTPAAATPDSGQAVLAASATPTDSTDTGALPFTGAELTSVVIAAILLLGSGAMLRRVGFAGSRRARRERS